MDTIALVPNNSLITETPEEGRQLAVKLARLIIKLTQPDEEKRKQLRDVYGNDAMMLIAVGQTVATSLLRLRLLTIIGKIVRFEMNDYCLVDCGFHDQLEALATLRQTYQISYRTVTEEIVEVESQIVDVYAANHADYLKLKDGTEIRLDRLIAVNGNPTRFAQE